MDKLNLIWFFDKKNVFEVDWIVEIFSDFNIIDHFDIDLKFDKKINHSLLVVQNINSPSFENYLKELEILNYKFKILHISDEALNHDIGYYENYSKRIIRMIYSEEYSKRFNIITIPVGYKPGLKKINTQKKYIVNFIGQIKSDRHNMLKVYSQVEPKFIKLTNQWNDPNGLSTEDYSLILSQSIFTLCPSGWVSVDSFRINESLECGSIPVSILYNGKNYFESLYGTNPFIIGENWNHTIEMITKVNIEEKRKEIDDWWASYKKGLRKKLKFFILKD